MSSWEMKFIASEAERLIAMSAQDVGIRAELRGLAGRILEATRPPLPRPSVEEAPSPPPEPLRELTLGRAPAPPPVIGASRPEPDEDDLGPIEARCRAKCEAVRWQAECHRRL